MKKLFVICCVLALATCAVLVGCDRGGDSSVVEQPVKVSFFADGELVADFTVNKGQTLSTMPEAPGKEGYVFEGWYDGDEVFDVFIAIDRDRSFSARYAPETPEI